MISALDRHVVGRLLRTRQVDAWGVASNEPRLPQSPDLPLAISVLMRIDPLIVRGLRHGPTHDYQDEYVRVNAALDDATSTLAEVLVRHGHAAERVPATATDGDGPQSFAHKTAATSAGLGWIGKTALFVSSRFGPAVRLATVFTDLGLPAGEPITAGRCGSCRSCVDACPAGCGRDVEWTAGMPLDVLFDAGACRHHIDSFQTVDVAICGICIAACPLSRPD